MHGHHHQQHTTAPSRTATVVLNLGPGVGALLLRTGPEDLHREIDISPADQPAARTHAAVRERFLASRTDYAALYADLAAGPYIIWHDDGTAAATVTVTEATVTEHDWRQ